MNFLLIVQSIFYIVAIIVFFTGGILLIANLFLWYKISRLLRSIMKNLEGLSEDIREEVMEQVYCLKKTLIGATFWSTLFGTLLRTSHAFVRDLHSSTKRKKSSE
ncbi:MAG: hypothetical protein COU08_04625 [Candidatus Harrisonbacteria bacterium CG10_big_fil_rev_8_21_14_0_10_42_17]|uniref:Uncharacterized protein n=1 Tax=Candidatus Harrisonbacteria bacterium CG10_big_fil_rev_8_21_14_0_10_42_17 TaxID=1974584 RepID=A0A2M6WH42_9BACT|nr:MAG: hypothetical protein COU08_04625 [Candidatus Harrisonbacteria bacterium CG10_big_fil_rev_8_21_14_0_10_42_17]